MRYVHIIRPFFFYVNLYGSIYLFEICTYNAKIFKLNKCSWSLAIEPYIYLEQKLAVLTLICKKIFILMCRRKER